MSNQKCRYINFFYCVLIISSLLFSLTELKEINGLSPEVKNTQELFKLGVKNLDKSLLQTAITNIKEIKDFKNIKNIDVNYADNDSVYKSNANQPSKNTNTKGSNQSSQSSKQSSQQSGKQTKETNTTNSKIGKIEDETKSFFVRIGHSIAAFFHGLVTVKLTKLKDYVFKKNINSQSWTDMYLFPMLKIFGLLAIFIVIIVITKVVITKFSEKLISKSNQLQNDTISNTDQSSYKQNQKEKILIKGRKKKMPNNINYNDLFSNIKPKSEQKENSNNNNNNIVNKNNNDNDNIEFFLDKVSKNEIRNSKKYEEDVISTIENNIKANKDLLFFNSDNFKDDESILLIQDIKDNDKKVKNRKESKEETLNDRLKNTNIFQQTLISKYMQK